MLHKNRIGVCLDNSIAYLLEEKNEEKVITIIEAGPEEDSASPTGENQSRFLKKVFDMVKDFEKISLFGPAKAKRELMRRIRASKLSHIEIQNNPIEDNVTENQKIDFINQYFST